MLPLRFIRDETICLFYLFITDSIQNVSKQPYGPSNVNLLLHIASGNHTEISAAVSMFWYSTHQLRTPVLKGSRA